MDRIGWKLYLVVMLLVLLAILAGDLTNERAFSFWSYADYLLSTAAMVGVFGYAFRFALLHENIWRLLLLLNVPMDILMATDIFKDPIVVSSPDDLWAYAIFAYVLTLILFCPEYIALYLYGCRSRNIWERSDTQ